MLGAVAEPARVSRLTLISPAGLPLRKPMARSLAQFGRQVALGRYDLREVRHDVRQVLQTPRGAFRLAQTVRSLDLGREMSRLARLEIAIEVVGCATDTLVTPLHCRVAAELLGAEYRELDLPGGHMWMLSAWPRLAHVL